jgi:DNA-binding beta-propeller fold protein YncE
MFRRVLRSLALLVLCMVYLPAVPVAGSAAATSGCTRINQRVTISGKTSLRSFCLFTYASLITMDSSGNLYVTVGRQGAGSLPRAGVVKLSQDGVVLGTFGSHGTRPGQFISPVGVAVDRSGNIYVSDGDLNRINKFSPDGKFLAKWGDGNGRGALSSPAGEAFDPHGHLWVADLYNNRIVEYSTSGKYLGACCKTSRRFIGFLHPMDLQFDAHGDMYVAEHLADAVAKFDPRGNFLGITQPTYGVIEGVALDSHGNVYEGAALPPGYIPKFSPSLKHITNIRVGSGGADLVVDRAGDLYLTDDSGNRIIKTDPTGKWLAVWK